MNRCDKHTNMALVSFYKFIRLISHQLDVQLCLLRERWLLYVTVRSLKCSVLISYKPILSNWKYDSNCKIYWHCLKLIPRLMTNDRTCFNRWRTDLSSLWMGSQRSLSECCYNPSTLLYCIFAANMLYALWGSWYGENGMHLANKKQWILCPIIGTQTCQMMNNSCKANDLQLLWDGAWHKRVSPPVTGYLHLASCSNARDAMRL